MPNAITDMKVRIESICQFQSFDDVTPLDRYARKILRRSFLLERSWAVFCQFNPVILRTSLSHLSGSVPFGLWRSLGLHSSTSFVHRSSILRITWPDHFHSHQRVTVLCDCQYTVRSLNEFGQLSGLTIVNQYWQDSLVEDLFKFIGMVDVKTEASN